MSRSPQSRDREACSPYFCQNTGAEICPAVAKRDMRAGKEDERAAFLRARSRKGDFGPQESGKRKDRIKVLGLREANSRKSGKFAENGNFGDVRAASFIRSF